MSESRINIMNNEFNIPDNWDKLKIKRLLLSKVTDGPHETPEFIDEGYPFLSVDSIVDGKLIFEGCRYISEEDYKRFKLKCNPQRDDVFMGKAASIGKIAIVDVDFNFSIWSPLALLRPNKNIILPKYLEYSLKSDYAQDQIDLYSTSNTQKNISMDDIPRIELFVPQIEQQNQIVNYLDKKTSMINETINKNKQLIELLEEKRITLINEVVTKGLNPDAPTKDSNVEWIGKIPKHWDLIKNKHIFKKSKVIVGPNWNKYNVLSLTKNGVIIKDIERNEGKMPSDFSIYQIVNPGNLLMCLFDIDVTPRCVGYIEKKGIVSSAYTELSAIDNINMKYYYWWYLMLDIDKRLLHLSKNLRNSLSTDDFMALTVVKPPLEEQKQIDEFLTNEISKINNTISKIEDNINLLDEYKTSLIHHVVTGKIDVRGEMI